MVRSVILIIVVYTQFDADKRQLFKETTAVAINTYCDESSDKCVVAHIRLR